MRVLHVVPTYWPAVRYGGPIYSVHGLCKALLEKGLQVEVFTTSVNGENDSDVQHDVATLVDEVGVTYFKSKYLRRIYYSNDLKLALEKRIKEFDLLHLHSVFLYPTNIAARIAIKHQVPYVISPRGMLEKQLIKSKSYWIKSLWLKAFEQYTLENAQLIHLTSDREKHELNQFDYRFPEIATIPNGVERVEQETLQERADDLSFKVLYIGRINWKKQIERIIEAVALLDFEVELMIVGDGEAEYLDSLKAKVSAAGIDDMDNIKVQFAKSKQGIDKQNLYINANVMILASMSENFGNTVIEAMAAGCPVIVTPEVGASEIVDSANCGLLTTGEPKDLANKVRYLYDNPLEARQMSANGVKEIEKNFLWSKVADSMTTAYNRVIN